MEHIDRRSFIRKTGAATAGAIVGSRVLGRTTKQNSPGDTVHVAVIGIRSRGREHIRALSEIPNVKIDIL